MLDDGVVDSSADSKLGMGVSFLGFDGVRILFLRRLSDQKRRRIFLPKIRKATSVRLEPMANQANDRAVGNIND